MAFLVYFFVLLVAGASVLFGLDWTQAPLNAPPYAAPPAQSASVTPNPAAKSPAVPTALKPPAPSLAVAKTIDKTIDKTADKTSTASQTPVAAPAAAPLDQASQAQASATPADTTASVPAAACNVSACSAAYRSFRAADCTYQPMSGERRLCSKSGSTGKVAAVAHPRSTHRAEPRDDYRDRRYYDRRDAYDDRRGGWGLGGLFGGDDY